ncbi:hypothetical protein SY88_22040 [Clostridiales bacterium PH28_bin88]|nr:hypothetical protein SY88_22040 [Clostridiales bacterium PH28_bin88]
MEVERTSLVSVDLAQRMAVISGLLQREVAVYLNRRGRVVGVALGEHDRVSLPDFQGRRGANRLSGIRCVHTHPGGSGMLSGVDCTALSSLRLDCMAALGLQNGLVTDIYAGFLRPATGSPDPEYLVKGPMTLHDLEGFDLMALVEAIEEELRGEEVLYTGDDRAERAVVVGLDMPSRGSAGYSAGESLAELAQLVEAAGATVVDAVLQRKGHVDRAYFIGKGLAEQLSLRLRQLRANLVVLDHEVSGTQARNLEALMGVKVIDRTAVILDIFAQRAKTREGKLQVELAQLQYMLPRLVGSGAQMSRLAGGIGTRGPGETKLETDRRHIRRRIEEIEKQLAEVQKHRRVQRAGRRGGTPTVALVGYTNAGKSTLRYCLVKRAASSRTNWEDEDAGTNRVFATLDPTLRGITLPGGKEVLVGDTVGFIQKLPHQLVSAFRATLEEVVEADLLLHVIDASSPRWEAQMAAVEQVLEELGVANKPRINVFNKMDLVEPGAVALPPADGNPCVTVSAVMGTGLDLLLEEMARVLRVETRQVRLSILYRYSGLLSELYAAVRVVSVNYQEDGIAVEAVVRDDQMHRYSDYLAP